MNMACTSWYMYKPVYLKKGSKYEYLVQSEDKEDDNEIIDFVPIQVII